ncbi:MAG: proteincyclic nucleotide-binding proteincache protein [Chlamydiales bacterium]|jgi:CRP-like cAMP-binding protein|nr:proteincyclic nucleotide-binding proteincache protein [Chlamydiales bacterium]
MDGIKDLKILIIDDEKRWPERSKILLTLGIQNPSYATELPEDIQPFNSILFISEDAAHIERGWQSYQKSPFFKKTPFILCSSIKSASLRACVQQGAAAVIASPLNPFQWLLTLKNTARIEPAKIEPLLAKIPFFSSLSQGEIQELSQVAIARIYQPNALITHNQAPNDHFYIVLKGAVEVQFELFKSTHQPPLAKPGSSFGELCLVGIPMPVKATAKEASVVLEIGHYLLNDPLYSICQKILAQTTKITAEKLKASWQILQEVAPSRLDEQLLHQPFPSAAIVHPSLPEPNSSEPIPEKKDAPLKEEELAVNAAESEPSQKAAPTDNAEPVEIQNKQIPAVAESYDESIETLNEYEVLIRKVNLHTDFVYQKIPEKLCEAICNRLHSYWVGSKLARHNPHRLLPNSLFLQGTSHFKQPMHMLVFAENGFEAYEECYSELPFTHHVIGTTDTDCRGTFLGSMEVIERFLTGNCLKKALWHDLEMPMSRLEKNTLTLETLSHTTQDIRNETIFLIFDDISGKITRLLREQYPDHQMLTVIKGLTGPTDDFIKLFAAPEEKLKEKGLLQMHREKRDCLYIGDTMLLPDLSPFYAKLEDKIKNYGYMFGMIGAVAQIGPEISGLHWGSKGGAAGALKAARALFGIRGAQSSADLAEAIQWAEGKTDNP